jgi:hypothetical protein
MNSTAAAQPSQHASTRQPKSHPIGPAPPVPTTAPPAPPSHQSPNTKHVNGQHTQNTKGKKRTDPPPPVDPATMYESVRSRIAALEEEEVLEEEEERRFGMSTLLNCLSLPQPLTSRGSPTVCPWPRRECNTCQIHRTSMFRLHSTRDTLLDAPPSLQSTSDWSEITRKKSKSF